MPESEEETRLSLRNEYTVVGASWRFLVGIRFAVLAFAATVLSALLGAYQYVLTNKDRLGDVGQTALWAVPALGIVTTIAIFLIEERTKILYTSCLQRGRKVEIELNIENGHFFQLAVAPLPCKIVSHTRAIRTIYILVFFVWNYLLFSPLFH
ncbi:MAG: hypothetical protein A3F85_04290 [Candidatus Ryanbacteria bacterium RIFCSPLOWO2_12_FULL_44_26]|nr:MAG: hypothetical protein A3F85_04290 [Candidatus Ryanbacteria bacterium RIFCSPLOWO2_12_FULL_44_26]